MKMGRMPIRRAAAAATSAPLMPGRPRIALTCGYRPLDAAVSPVKALQESTPQSSRFGCTAADRTCTFTSGALSSTVCRSWPVTVEASDGAGAAPITAEKNGVRPLARITCALQTRPDLHGLSTSLPLSSRMPRLHGVSVRSALATAVRLTVPPACASVVFAARTTESHIGDTVSDVASAPDPGALVPRRVT